MVISALLLIGLAQGCADPYRTARVTEIHRRGNLVFLFDRGKPLREVDVIGALEGNRRSVLWRITRDGKICEAPREILYGDVPDGFRQIIPRSGPPAPLREGTYTIRSRDYALEDDGEHYFRFGLGAEDLWRVEIGRSNGFGEGDRMFRIHTDGRIQLLDPNFTDRGTGEERDHPS